MTQLQKVIDVLDPSDIIVPLDIQEFYSAEFAVAEQNKFREIYVKDYCESLITAIKRYVTFGAIGAFLTGTNLEILTRKVKSELSLEQFSSLPDEVMIKKVLLIMLEMK